MRGSARAPRGGALVVASTEGDEPAGGAAVWAIRADASERAGARTSADLVAQPDNLFLGGGGFSERTPNGHAGVFHVEHEDQRAESTRWLRKSLAAAGVPASEEALERLWAAAQWLGELAGASGISAYERPDDALERGLGPAIAYFSLPEAPRRGLLGDLGAGNGALGAGIAILEPNLQVRLLDRAQRAYTACELLAARLRLPNLEAVLLDAGEVGRGGHMRAYDAIVFRALAGGAEALNLAERLLAPGGFIGAYHRDGDVAFQEPPIQGIEAVSTAETVVPGLVLSGFRALRTGFPQ